MKIKIKDKDYELRWTLEAINFLDKKYTYDFEMSGMKVGFGAGLQSGVSQLSLKSPVVVYNFIKAGLLHYKSKDFTMDSIEKAMIDRIEEDGSIDKLIEDIKKSLKSNPLTRSSVSDVEKEVEKKEEEKAHEEVKDK